MHPSRLLLFFLIATAGLTGVAEAQLCYKQTSEYIEGNLFVKPMTDSTCFGQWHSQLFYYNYITGDTLFRFISDVYYPFPPFQHVGISDVLRFDSLLIVSWEAGTVYRILKVDFRGGVSEIPTALDSIPLLKNSKYVGRSIRGRKLTVVNDSVFLMSSTECIYSFCRSVDTVACVDSMELHGNWWALDLYGDTVVVLYAEDNEARFYHVHAGGKITYSATVGIEVDWSLPKDVYFRYGNLYVNLGALWRALVRTPEGFKLTPGSTESPIGLWQPLFGKKNVMIVGEYDEIGVYDQSFNLLCHKAPLNSVFVMSSGIYGDKVFLATSDGISTWIPDTSTSSVISPPFAKRPSGIEVWPNPSTSGTITVRSEEPASAIELTDVAGRVVYRSSQSDVGATIIPTALLPAGVYFVNAHTAQGMLSERVVILRTGE